MEPKLPFARCERCPLRDKAAVPGFGPENAEVIVLGEAPGQGEEIEGKPFVGPSGKLLDAAIQRATDGEVTIDGIYRTNVVACRPDNNREPSALEIECCSGRLKHELEKVGGTRILALGNTAQLVLGVGGKQRGAVYEVEGGYSVMPIYHPAYVLRDPDEASTFLAQVERFFAQDSFEPPDWPEVEWTKTAQDLEAELREVPDGAWVAFDLETDQVRWYDGADRTADFILMLQLCWDPHFAIIVSDELLYDDPDVPRILQKFFDRVSLVGHNCKFDAVFLKAHIGVSVHQDFDTMLAHYCLDENLLHGLKPMMTQYFGMPDYEVETIKPYLRTKSDRYSKVPPNELARYGAMDVAGTLLLRPILEDQLLRSGQFADPFMKVLMRAANKLSEMELRGMQVDPEQLAVSSERFQSRLDLLRAEMREMVGNPDYNPRSTRETAVVLYDQLSMPIYKSRKVKPRSTNKDVLEKYKDRHPFIPLLREYRRVDKLKSSYVDNLLDLADAHNRVHANFKIQGTEVGRLSVVAPALQTVPRPYEDYYGALIRSAFVAPEGKMLVAVDYSQAELRVFAARSGEPFLLTVYREGRDLHSEVAAAMYGEGYTKAQRVLCKMFNFSYLYGGTEYSFAQDAGLNIDMARSFVHRYNEMMPVGLAYKRQLFQEMKANGYVETIFGRRRHFPLITISNIEEARKAAVHMPCASTASDLTLISAMDSMDDGIPVVLMVHDSIIAEVDEQYAEEAGKVIAGHMVKNGDKYLPEVPWVVETSIAKRWAEPWPEQTPTQ